MGHNETIDAIASERQAITEMKLDKANRKRLDEIVGNLEAGESLRWFCVGQQLKKKNAQGENTIGVLAVTDRRLVYCGKLMFKSEVESFPLDRVNSVSQSSGMMLAGVTVTGGGFSFDLQRVNKKDATEAVQRIRAAVADYAGKSADKQQGPAVRSIADEIRELAKLRDDGLLTEDEFAIQKARLLG